MIRKNGVAHTAAPELFLDFADVAGGAVSGDVAVVVFGGTLNVTDGTIDGTQPNTGIFSAPVFSFTFSIEIFFGENPLALRP